MEHEDSSHYEHHESHETHRKKKNTTEKLRTNPWIISTFVLGILAIILIVGSVTGGITGKVISENQAGNIISDLVRPQIGEIEILDISKESGIYKIDFESEKTGKSSIYLTLDGNYFISGLVSLAVEEEEYREESSEPTFTEEQNALIQEFSSCLYNKGMRVYYAGWCGHCHNFIETFGGLENAGNMMIECQTEDRQDGTGVALCAAENIAGFPTIKINGEQYSSARTLESLGEATGCSVPELEGTGVVASSSDTSC